MRATFVIVLLVFSAGLLASASTINVPADQPTIQAGINAAVNGDTVLVAPGTYFENINFMGKAITVKSSGGAKTTIIDGGGIASVVTFNSGETTSSVLTGFTIAHGKASFEGGGIFTSASPTILKNIVRNNMACDDGGGIAVSFASPIIKQNTINSNSQSASCVGGSGGGGISVTGAASAQIVGNNITGNSWGNAGGGISLFAAGTPLVTGNLIKNNSAGKAGQGGGIYLANAGGELIIQNLLVGNTAGTGAGIYFTGGSAGPILVNNTFVQNSGAQLGSSFYLSGSTVHIVVFNNIFTGPRGTTAVYCDNSANFPPVFSSNDAYATNGTGFGGDCAGEAVKDGNITSDPTFVNQKKGNYQLQAGSPAIDVGNNSAPDLPKKDLAGKPRIVDGNGDGTAIIDMGAYEFQ